jgi:predicted DNA-binding transcriptional regulator AlpA
MIENTPAAPRTIRRREPPSDPPPPIRHHHLDRRAADLAQEGAAAGDENELLTTTEVSEWLQISPQWLEIGRSKSYGPKFVRLSPRRVRYRRADVLAFLIERTHKATAEYSRRPSAGAPVDAA